MDAVNVKENMRINWVSESGIVENIIQIIKEYKDSRKLQVTCVFKTNLYDLIEIKHECKFFFWGEEGEAFCSLQFCDF